MGSFLHSCIDRAPRGASVIWARSRCPRCDHTLGPADLIPVVSYFLLGGRCRYCGKPIGISHIWVELCTAALAVGAMVLEGLSFGFFRTFGLGCIFFVVAILDFRKLIIPDGFIVLGLLIAVFGLPWARDLSAFDAGMGFLLGGGSFALIRIGYRSFRGREGMGAGDVKLAALAGASLGVWGWIQATVLGSLAGAAVGLGLILTRRATWKTPLPYGTFLALAAIAVLFGIGRSP